LEKYYEKGNLRKGNYMRSFLKNYKKNIVTVFLVVTVVAIGTSQATTISLGTAADFAVLGSSAVTNAEPATRINGDVGSSPTESVSGLDASNMVTGHLYLAGDSPTLKSIAHDDASAAYIAARDATGFVPGPANLGGATLAPGVYKYTSTAAWAVGSGDLTLDATLGGLFDPSAQWIFQVGTGMTTPADVNVLLIHGASANNVFWQIGTDFTLGARNNFAGNILSGAGITLGGGTLNGRALAGTLVSIDTATTINAPIPEPTTLCLLGFGVLSVIRRKKLA
jgi:hypothetical protein